MFDDAMLDSSPAHTSVFQPHHWFLALSVGVGGFLAGFLLIPFVFLPLETKVLTMQAAILGTVLMFYALMLCYVYAEARRLRLRVWLWLCTALVLNLPGFFAFLVRSAMKTGNWKRAAVPAAYLLEAALISTLVLVPLIHTEALSKLVTARRLEPPLPPPGPARGRAAPSRPVATPRRSQQNVLITPPVIPRTITLFREELKPNEDVDRAFVPGAPNGWPGGTADGIPGSPFPGTSSPPPPVVRREPRAAAIRIGGDVAAARVICRPEPVYPELALKTRTQGTVRLEAIIGTEGTIQKLKVLSGHPLLVRAALEAVAHWRYQPALLNGEPVEVITDIEVKFTLDN